MSGRLRRMKQLISFVKRNIDHYSTSYNWWQRWPPKPAKRMPMSMPTTSMMTTPETRTAETAPPPAPSPAAAAAMMMSSPTTRHLHST
jgi:hypothetical protein